MGDLKRELHRNKAVTQRLIDDKQMSIHETPRGIRGAARARIAPQGRRADDRRRDPEQRSDGIGARDRFRLLARLAHYDSLAYRRGPREYDFSKVAFRAGRFSDLGVDFVDLGEHCYRKPDSADYHCVQYVMNSDYCYV